METEQATRLIDEFFPLEKPREKQVKALAFIEKAHQHGYRDVVIAAPTGIGKTGIGVAACLWADQAELEGAPGGYYLVTQKLLQDQLEHDFTKFLPGYRNRCASIKSSIEYPCPRYGTCMAGGRQLEKHRRCQRKMDGLCPYTLAHERFSSLPVSVTNYPFFMTERTYVKKLPPRRILVCDECFPGGTPVLTDHGAIPLDVLAHSKNLPKALCWTGYGFVYKPIVQAWSNGSRSLVRIKTGCGDIVCTENHKLLTENGWKPAHALSADDTLLCKKSGKFTRELNDDQRQLVIGSFLGDGSLEKVPGGHRLIWTHGAAQSAYLRWKASLLHARIEHIDHNGFSGKKAIRAISPSFTIPSTTQRPKRRVPKWMIDAMDQRALAIWYMDDGSGKSNGATLHTESFSKETCCALRNHLYKKFKLTALVDQTKGRYYVLRFRKEAAQRLYGLIRLHVHPSLRRKVPLHTSFSAWNSEFSPNLQQVLRVEKNRIKSEVYDLEVAEHHNFLVQANHSKSRSSWAKTAFIAHNCHTIEKQILGFVDITIDRAALDDWAPHLRPVPDMPRVDQFTDWLEKKYMPAIKGRYEMKEAEALGSNDRRIHQEMTALQNHYGRVQIVYEALRNDDDYNWIYWQETVDGERTSTAKPVEAAPYAQELIYDGGTMRVFMSAYPGPKDVFCRSIGLDAEKVAWCSLASTFPVANRPIHLTFVGSMGQRSLEYTRPRLVRRIEKILDVHRGEKGVIHCLDEKTRVMTDSGLKYHHEIEASDLVMTLNPSRHAVEYQKPKFWVRRKHVGTLVSVQNCSLDFAVTEDHFVYAAPGRNGKRYALLRAGSLTGGRKVFGRKKARFFKVPRAGRWHGTPGNGLLSSVDGARFLGWFLSEGCAFQTQWNRVISRIISIAQTDIAQTEIPGICRRLGLHPYISPSQPNQIIIQKKSLWKWLRQHCYTGDVYDCFHKTAPVDLRNAPSEILKACLDAMIAGDGSRNKNNGLRCGRAHAYYTTTSWSLCQDVVEMAIKCGYSAVFRQVDRKRWKPSVLEGRVIKGSTIFVIEIGASGSHAWFHESEIKEVPYTGVVFCPSTANGIVLVERNGKCFWTGNCHSYKLGIAIHAHLQQSAHADRVLFPTKAEERSVMLARHSGSSEPTVLLSPSMTDGFSLDDDLARWQVIAKVPYPYLGNRQVAAKRDRDPDWYAMQTAMTIIQACGRIVRSEEDWGATYILDSDFGTLYDRHRHFFPPWFQQAFHWHDA